MSALPRTCLLPQAGAVPVCHSVTLSFFTTKVDVIMSFRAIVVRAREFVCCKALVLGGLLLRLFSRLNGL